MERFVKNTCIDTHGESEGHLRFLSTLVLTRGIPELRQGGPRLMRVKAYALTPLTETINASIRNGMVSLLTVQYLRADSVQYSLAGTSVTELYVHCTDPGNHSPTHFIQRKRNKM